MIRVVLTENSAQMPPMPLPCMTISPAFRHIYGMQLVSVDGNPGGALRKLLDKMAATQRDKPFRLRKHWMFVVISDKPHVATLRKLDIVNHMRAVEIRANDALDDFRELLLLSGLITEYEA